jgi:NAD(P)-dependent dehydrogenase (short-subunit alcohol dehydrogenase family)
MVAEEIKAVTGNPDVHTAALELTDRKSVADFADAWKGPLHLLINNAGVMMIQELVRDARGHEMQFAPTTWVTSISRPASGALAAAGGARVVMLSSSGHLYGPVVFDDIDYRFRSYDPLSAYAQSKTAEILFAVGATQRRGQAGHPRRPAEDRSARGIHDDLRRSLAPRGAHRWPVLQRQHRSHSGR